MAELLARIERRFRFSGEELLRLLATVVVAAFVLTFRKWGGDEFNLYEGIFNMLTSTIVVFVSLFIHFSAQKIMALHLGYSSEYKLWLNGILISVIVCFFSFGYFPLFFPGVLIFDMIPKLRIGSFKGGVKTVDLAVAAVAGPGANLILVGLIAPFYIHSNSPFLYSVILINLLIAIFSMLPIPTFEQIRQFRGGTTGLYLFIESRWIYVGASVLVLFFSLMILIANIFSYILAILAGLIAGLTYYAVYDQESK
ncbi:MAG: hypothetical protein V1866_07335 [archaeon]